MARHNPAELATGALVLVIAGGFLIFAVANTGQRFGKGYPLHASFDHVDGLSVGADVKIAGVKVGSVENIHLDTKTYQAVVSFNVQNGVALSTDSSATVATEGLLGGKYLAIAEGGEEKNLPPGGEVAITQGSVNLEALLGKYIFGGPTKGGDSKAGRPEKRHRKRYRSAEVMAADAVLWLQADGTPVSCTEKLKILEENRAELAQVMQDAFEDAVLMGVDEAAMRAMLKDMTTSLRTPRR